MSSIVINPSNDEEWDQYFRIRYEVLRKPWNEPEGSERDAEEDCSWHFAVKSGLELTGVCRLQRLADGTGQVRYMAVKYEHQGKGIGALLLDAAEQKGKKEGMHKIILHARENAVPFYENQGYRIVEKSYLLFDSIQHFLMHKDL
jgi:GNAT superfamily N-acetyltransferase